MGVANGNYRDGGLVGALRAYMIKSGIFNATEITDLSRLTKPIALFALTSMHGCVLKREGGSTLVLAIRGGRSSLEMGLTAPMPTKPEMSVNLCVFSTSLSLDTAVGQLRRDLPPSDAAVTIEPTSDGHLRYLGRPAQTALARRE